MMKVYVQSLMESNKLMMIKQNFVKTLYHTYPQLPKKGEGFEFYHFLLNHFRNVTLFR